MSNVSKIFQVEDWDYMNVLASTYSTVECGDAIFLAFSSDDCEVETRYGLSKADAEYLIRKLTAALLLIDEEDADE